MSRKLKSKKLNLKKIKLPKIKLKFKTKKSFFKKLKKALNPKKVLSSIFKKDKKPSKKQKRINFVVNFVFILLAIALSFSYFAHSTIFRLAKVETAKLITSYYQAWLVVFKQYWYFFIASFIFSLVLKTFLNYKLSKKSLLTAGLFNFILMIAITATSFHTSLAFATILRINHLKQAVTTANTNPKELGLYLGKDQVADQLSKSDHAPAIKQVNGDFDQKALLLTVKPHDKAGEFYQDTLALNLNDKYWPEYQLPDENIILFNEQLLFNEVSQEDFQAISPKLGYLLIRDYFDPRSIKEDADIEVIGRQAYLEFRDDQINDQLAEIDQSIASLNGQIAAKRRAMTEVIVKFYYGQLSYGEALSQYDSLRGQIGQLSAEIAELREIRKFVEAQKDQTPQELGIFLPEDDNKIKVVLDVTNPEAINNYLAILAHEYLHFTSYVDDERRLTMFFEEGLTEHFARQAVKENLGVDVKVGYPLIVKVIEAFAAKLDEDELAEVYFTKDEEKLERILDEAFGKDFYEDSQMHFIMIPFAPVDKAVKYANDLINEAGGKEVKLEDIKQEMEENEEKAKPSEDGDQEESEDKEEE